MNTITMTDAKNLYTIGNDNGSGYAPYADVAGDDTIENARDAAADDGWTVVLERTNSDEIVVLTNDDGEMMGIGGDAMGRGAWAVMLSDVSVD